MFDNREPPKDKMHADGDLDTKAGNWNNKKAIKNSIKEKAQGWLQQRSKSSNGCLRNEIPCARKSQKPHL